jgi:hypothetical protein
MRAFKERQKKGFSGQNGLLLGQKAGKKQGLQLPIR